MCSKSTSLPTHVRVGGRRCGRSAKEWVGRTRPLLDTLVLVSYVSKKLPHVAPRLQYKLNQEMQLHTHFNLLRFTSRPSVSVLVCM